MTPTISNILLKFDTALQETLELKNGATIFLASWLNKEENASVIAEVVSIGGKCELTYQIDGVEHQVKPGDQVACSYHVVARHTLDDDGVTTYHNQYLVNGQKVWLATDWNIMAVKKDQWYGVNDWVLMTEVYEKPLTSSFLILPDMVTAPKIVPSKGKVVSGDLKDQEVCFGEKFRSLYRFGAEKYIVLKSERIEGIYKNVA